MSTPGPFTVLGLEPTLDLAAVKRAWFTALERHPPHRDPEGFQRLRRAYETLSQPGGLAAAFLASPPDVAGALAAWRARFEAPLTRAAESLRAQRVGAESAAHLVERCSRLGWGEALEVFGTA
jgi:curved DNA-binding protein CbpA